MKLTAQQKAQIKEVISLHKANYFVGQNIPTGRAAERTHVGNIMFETVNEFTERLDEVIILFLEKQILK